MRDEAVGLGTEAGPPNMPSYAQFVIKDSGKRAEFSGGMVRDIADDKIDYTLITDGPMFKRWAVHLTNGAKKYAKRNWMKAEGDVEMARFKESAFRHFMQWYYGEVDEDHASAVYFNINGFEYVKGKTGDNPR
jgi:dATP/dGTP diphosphohydrolase